MLGRLLLLFIAVPFVELVLLIWLGTRIGFWPTLGVILVTGTLGAFLMRVQGTRILTGIRAELAAGRVPAAQLLDGFLILVGGMCLLTPGLIGDVFGLVLLLPFTRNRLRASLRRRFEWMARTGQVNFMMLLR